MNIKLFATFGSDESQGSIENDVVDVPVTFSQIPVSHVGFDGTSLDLSQLNQEKDHLILFVVEAYVMGNVGEVRGRIKIDDVQKDEEANFDENVNEDGGRWSTNDGGRTASRVVIPAGTTGTLTTYAAMRGDTSACGIGGGPWGNGTVLQVWEI